MFRKLLLTVTLSLFALCAVADEVPALSPAEAASAAVPAEAAVSNSLTGKFGGLLGMAARSLVDVTRPFVEGVKRGYSSKDAQPAKVAEVSAVALPAPVTASAPVSTPVVAASNAAAPQAAAQMESPALEMLARFAGLTALADVRAKLAAASVASRQTPAPLEIREIRPTAQAAPVVEPSTAQ